jgi:hypothetical protein
MPNRLAAERSPYLLQHQENPVDWFPWGEEAFARARQDDKPIFLSVGYSTCHWCHVMAHESFESAAVAEVLNRDFVSIKVDREERPDVDRVYMTFVQATTGSGGWPMNVWLTPSLEPFYGGTYFPPASKWGRAGFLDILQEIARVWQSEHDTVLQSAATVVERLRAVRAEGRASGVPGPEVLAHARQEFAAAFDAQRGGFGGAPKFPRPSELVFLLREHTRTGDPAARDMALATLRAMARGGLRDHLGGGFHRYAVDGDWRVPHFEKMLYDQAQLVLAYVEAAQITGDAFYRDVAFDTLDYVRRDLTGPDGELYSAEDADSVPPEHAGEPRAHTVEGAFYVWSEADVRDALGTDAEAEIFSLRYGIRPDGNAPSDPQGEFTGKNLLYAAREIEEIAGQTGTSVTEVHRILERSRETLLRRRASRPRPHLDDKVLTAWNGLMIAAFAGAARLPSSGGAGRGAAAGGDYLEDGRRAARFIRTHLWDERRGVLRRRFRTGEAGVDGYAEDYACLIFGLLALFQVDGDPEWLEWALRLQERQDELFWDQQDGGWFSTTGRDPSVLLRLKEDYDGAEPAASSIAVSNLLLLSHMVGGGGDGTTLSRDYAEKISRTFGLFAARAAQSGRAVPMMLASLSTYHAGVSQLVIAGDGTQEGTSSLWRVVGASHLPATVVIPVVPRHRDGLVHVLPWIAAMTTSPQRPAAYLCHDFTCEAPATSPDRLREQLDRLRGLERR